jgi:flavodoxin
MAWREWHLTSFLLSAVKEKTTHIDRKNKKSVISGTLFEIEPVQPYTPDYRAAVAQAMEEIQAGFRPDLKALPEITSYSVVFLGTPIWWHTMAPPVAALIERFDLNGKTVVPFHTHGGGGVGLFEENIA